MWWFSVAGHGNVKHNIVKVQQGSVKYVHEEQGYCYDMVR